MKKDRIMNNDSKFQINVYFFEIVAICFGLKMILNIFNITEFSNIDSLSLLVAIGFNYDLNGKDNFFKFTYYKEGSNENEASEL